MMRAQVMCPTYVYPPTYPYGYFYYNPWTGYYVWEW